MHLLIRPGGDALVVYSDGRAVRVRPDGETVPADALERDAGDGGCEQLVQHSQGIRYPARDSHGRG